jgi:hypothetical protein
MTVLLISTQTEGDLAEAVAWYNQVRAGLGSSLMLCFEEALNRVIDHPEAFPTVLPGVRRALIRRFPYGVFFRVRSKRIEVEAFFHLRADPARLANRLVRTGLPF